MYEEISENSLSSLAKFFPNDFDTIWRIKIGGSGSNQYFTNVKSTTQRFFSLDIQTFHRKGILEPGACFTCPYRHGGKLVGHLRTRNTEDNNLILEFNSLQDSEHWKIISPPIKLLWTPCHFGGQRPWFCCPAPKCGRRSGRLYLSEGLACRKCHDLVYQSQRETSYDRAGDRANKLREQLSWSGNFMDPNEFKPKGMHWKTYERLVNRHADFAEKALLDAGAKFGSFFWEFFGISPGSIEQLGYREIVDER